MVTTVAARTLSLVVAVVRVLALVALVVVVLQLLVAAVVVLVSVALMPLPLLLLLLLLLPRSTLLQTAAASAAVSLQRPQQTHWEGVVAMLAVSRTPGKREAAFCE